MNWTLHWLKCTGFDVHMTYTILRWGATSVQVVQNPPYCEAQNFQLHSDYQLCLNIGKMSRMVCRRRPIPPPPAPPRHRHMLFYYFGILLQKETWISSISGERECTGYTILYSGVFISVHRDSWRPTERKGCSGLTCFIYPPVRLPLADDCGKVDKSTSTIPSTMARSILCCILMAYYMVSVGKYM